ncbi:MAG: DEAD/DEAH box helicase [archaeon]|nr:DEAD/DEAH box helicase [archaeon]
MERPAAKKPCIKNAESGPVEGKEDGTSSYWRVMWCKASRKKHKSYNDGVLSIKSSGAMMLQDMDGTAIGRTTSYNKTVPAKPSSGDTLEFSGKEIELAQTLAEEEYLSGALFKKAKKELEDVAAAAASSTAKIQSTAKALRGFSQHSTAHLEAAGGAMTGLPAKPRPPLAGDAPNAVVLWRSEDGDAVVVDPVLAKHLRPHQREGVKFMFERTVANESGYAGCILADAMGLGKTLQAITLIWTLMKQGFGQGKGAPLVRRALVVTPTSLLNNWCKEIRHWLSPSRLDPYVLSAKNGGQAAKYPAAQLIHDWGQAPPKRSLLITSYDQYRQHHKRINAVRYGLIVCDEGHRLKNPAAQISCALMTAPTQRRVILSGTPLQNDLEEFFTMVNFVNPGILSTPASFRSEYSAPILHAREPGSTEEEKWLGAAQARELTQVTSAFILRRQASILEDYLPPKVEQVVFCAPSPLQIASYHHLLDSIDLNACLSDSASALSLIIKLRKVANHPALLIPATFHSSEQQPLEHHQQLKMESLTASSRADDEVDQVNSDSDSDSDEILDEQVLDDEQEALDEDAGDRLVRLEPHFAKNPLASEFSGKLQVVEAMLQSILALPSKDRVVIVSLFSKTLDVIQQLCTSCGHRFLRLDGSVPAALRQGLVDRFNDPHSGVSVFLLTSKAGAVGLNLVGANRLILFDADWNPATDHQAMARIWRDGQPKVAWIYRLLTTGTIDEKIFQRQVAKDALAQSIIDDRVTSKRFTKEDLKDLFSFNQAVVSDTHDLMGCRCHSASSSSEKNKKEKKQDRSLDSLSSMLHLNDPDHPQFDPILKDVLEHHPDLITLTFQSRTRTKN